jgi:hypothetical protein
VRLVGYAVIHQVRLAGLTESYADRADRLCSLLLFHSPILPPFSVLPFFLSFLSSFPSCSLSLLRFLSQIPPTCTRPSLHSTSVYTAFLPFHQVAYSRSCQPPDACTPASTGLGRRPTVSSTSTTTAPPRLAGRPRTRQGAPLPSSRRPPRRCPPTPTQPRRRRGASDGRGSGARRGRRASP